MDTDQIIAKLDQLGYRKPMTIGGMEFLHCYEGLSIAANSEGGLTIYIIDMSPYQKALLRQQFLDVPIQDLDESRKPRLRLV